MGKYNLSEEQQREIFNMWLKEYGNSIGERCEYCNSINISVFKHNTSLEEDKMIYRALYTCNDCGAKAEVKEVWNK